MKKPNHTQKQWALTAGLVTVLSFNLVMGLSGSSAESTASLASKIADSDNTDDAEIDTSKFASLITEDGKLKVKYVQREDGKTVAIVPKKVEGEYCWEECGKKYLLPKNFDSSKDDLEMALRRAMKSASVKVVEQDSSDSEDLDEVVAERSKRLRQQLREDREDMIEEEEDKDLLALEKKCDRKEEDSRMECFANGLTRLLKDRRKEHAKENVLDLYKKEIEPGLIESMTDMRDSDRRDTGQSILEDMLASVGKKYNYLRERLVKLSALVVIKSQQDAQKKFQQAEQVKMTNPGQALRLQTEGFNRRSFAENMAMNMDSTLQSGLESAQFSRLISENQVVDLYTNQYLDVVNPIIQGMRQNPLTYVIQTSPLTDGNGLMNNGLTVSPISSEIGPFNQLRSSGRGIVVIGNGLTPANVVPTNAPRISTLPNGMSTPGTATIQVIPANQIPVNQFQSNSGSAVIPANGPMGFRRGY